MPDHTLNENIIEPSREAPAAPSPQSPYQAPPADEAALRTSAVDTIGIGEVSDDPEDHGVRRPRFWQLVAALTIRDRRDGPILRESTLWLDSKSREELPEELARFMDECEQTIGQPCWVNTGILRLDEDGRAELLGALEHLREGRVLGACGRVAQVLQQADDSISPRTLAEALVEVSYLIPTQDGTLRKRPGLTNLEVLQFMQDNNFPILFFPTEMQAHCVSSMEYHVVAADLDAREEDQGPGNLRYFIEVVRNGAGSESAIVYRCPRPQGLANDIVWSVDVPSVLPERFHRPIRADGTFLEPYEFIGLRRASFDDAYRELATSGLPPKVWVGGRIVPPRDVLNGRLGVPDTTQPEACGEGESLKPSGERRKQVL